MMIHFISGAMTIGGRCECRYAVTELNLASVVSLNHDRSLLTCSLSKREFGRAFLLFVRSCSDRTIGARPGLEKHRLIARH